MTGLQASTTHAPEAPPAAAAALSALDSAIAGAQSLGYAGADVATAGTSRSEALCALLLLSESHT